MLRFGGIIAGAALPFPIDKPRRGWYTEFVCGYGGIGRRARLRIWYLRCAGSTPVTRTTSEWTALHSKSPAERLGFSHTAPSFLLLPAKLCFANFRRGPGRPAGRQTCKLCIACGDFFKSPTRSLRCGSFSPQNFAAQTFVGAPAAPRAAYRLCSIQKARPVGRAFLISLHHSISAQEPPLTRRLASKRACGRSPSPRGILPVQTSAGAPAARRAANTQAVHRLRRLILSHRRARSAAAPSPHKILLRKLSWGPRPPRGRLIDFAPFKKPGRLAGLFSYRSIIPSRPKSRRLRGGWPRNAPAGAVLLPAEFC